MFIKETYIYSVSCRNRVKRLTAYNYVRLIQSLAEMLVQKEGVR
jgi:hypothetical protein